MQKLTTPQIRLPNILINPHELAHVQKISALLPPSQEDMHLNIEMPFSGIALVEF